MDDERGTGGEPPKDKAADEQPRSPLAPPPSRRGMKSAPGMVAVLLFTLAVFAVVVVVLALT